MGWFRKRSGESPTPPQRHALRGTTRDADAHRDGGAPPTATHTCLRFQSVSTARQHTIRKLELTSGARQNTARAIESTQSGLKLGKKHEKIIQKGVLPLFRPGGMPTAKACIDI